MDTSVKRDDFQEKDESLNIYLVIIKLIDYGIKEFIIDDVIFSIPYAQEIERPKEYPSVVGQLIPLGNVHNQRLFVYAGPIEPPIIPLPQPHEGVFCNLLEYLSPYMKSFIQIYFDRCQ